jgi:hypothetical protein
MHCITSSLSLHEAICGRSCIEHIRDIPVIVHITLHAISKQSILKIIAIIFLKLWYLIVSRFIFSIYNVRSFLVNWTTNLDKFSCYSYRNIVFLLFVHVFIWLQFSICDPSPVVSNLNLYSDIIRIRIRIWSLSEPTRMCLNNIVKDMKSVKFYPIRLHP